MGRECVPLLSRLRGLVERCKLPRRGPRPRTSFGTFRAWRTHLMATNLIFFWHFYGTYFCTFTFTIILNVRLRVYICPCYSAKTVVIFFHTALGRGHWPLRPTYGYAYSMDIHRAPLGQTYAAVTSVFRTVITLSSLVRNSHPIILYIIWIVVLVRNRCSLVLW